MEYDKDTTTADASLHDVCFVPTPQSQSSILEDSHSASRSESNEKASQPTEHTLVAWAQVLASFLLVVNGFGYFSAFSLFESHWEQILDREISDISWVGSLQLSLLFFMGTLSGRLMDAGFFRSLIITGCALQVLGGFTTSAVTEYWQLILAQGIAQGLGNGMLFTPLVTLVALYFDKHRPIALGVAACGAPVGGVVFTMIARQLRDRLSYPWIIRVMSFVILFNTAIVLLLAKPKTMRRPSAPWFDLRSWREPTYAFFAAGIFLVCWGLYFAYFYTTTFGTSRLGLSPSTSLLLLEIMNAVGIPGRLGPALLANLYFGSFTTLVPFSLAAGILLFTWMAVTGLQGYVAFLVLYGICANAVQTLFPSALASLTKDPAKMGVRTGMVFTVVGFACLTGPPIAGALISCGGGSYVFAQVFGGTSVISGACVLMVSWWLNARQSNVG